MLWKIVLEGTDEFFDPSVGSGYRQGYEAPVGLARSASRSRMARPSWLISGRWSSSSNARPTF
jgi:hypothetical protein